MEETKKVMPTVRAKIEQTLEKLEEELVRSHLLRTQSILLSFLTNIQREAAKVKEAWPPLRISQRRRRRLKLERRFLLRVPKLMRIKSRIEA